MSKNVTLWPPAPDGHSTHTDSHTLHPSIQHTQGYSRLEQIALSPLALVRGKAGRKHQKAAKAMKAEAS